MPQPNGFRTAGAPLRSVLYAGLFSAVLAACGGGGGNASDTAAGGTGSAPAPAPAPTPAPTPPPPAPAPPIVVEPTGPGRTVSVERLALFTAAQVQQAWAAQAAAGGVPAPLAPSYDVAAYRITYLTLDAEGRELPASGLMAVPQKAPGQASPVLSWQHGTLFYDAQAPSNAIVPTEPPMLLAAAGYFVVAADYVGYGASRGVPHPYLLSAPSAAAVLDLLTAARLWRLRQGVAGNGQLFMAGFSEGGYTTMAAHRALEATAAAAPAGLSAPAADIWATHRAELALVLGGAGPYHLAATLDALLEQIRDESPLLAALIDPGFLRRLGSGLRNEVRRLLVRKLIPGDADVAFDTRFVDPFLSDHRDIIERQSNVHDWRPVVPLRLFHGREDLTVPFASSTSTLGAMLARAAPDVTLTECGTRPAGHLECWPDYLAWVAARLGERARGL